MVVDEEFRCPQCDSKKFGGLPTRFCHGVVFDSSIKGDLIPIPCQFQWHVSEDWKHMRLVIRATSKEDAGPSVVRSYAIKTEMRRVA